MLGQASAGPSLRALTFTIWEKVLSACCTRSRCLRSWSARRLSASGCPGCKCSVADSRTFSYSRDPLGSSPLTVVTVLWKECGPRVTSSCQEPGAASCRYERMEPSPSQSCSLGSRKRERTPGHPSVSAFGDTLPLQSPGSPRTHPIQPPQREGRVRANHTADCPVQRGTDGPSMLPGGRATGTSVIGPHSLSPDPTLGSQGTRLTAKIQLWGLCIHHVLPSLQPSRPSALNSPHLSAHLKGSPSFPLETLFHGFWDTPFAWFPPTLWHLFFSVLCWFLRSNQGSILRPQLYLHPLPKGARSGHGFPPHPHAAHAQGLSPAPLPGTAGGKRPPQHLSSGFLTGTWRTWSDQFRPVFHTLW